MKKKIEEKDSHRIVITEVGKEKKKHGRGETERVG